MDDKVCAQQQGFACSVKTNDSQDDLGDGSNPIGSGAPSMTTTSSTPFTMVLLPEGEFFDFGDADLATMVKEAKTKDELNTAQSDDIQSETLCCRLPRCRETDCQAGGKEDH